MAGGTEAAGGGHARAAHTQPGRHTLLGRRSREEARDGRPESPEGSVSQSPLNRQQMPPPEGVGRSGFSSFLQLVGHRAAAGWRHSRIRLSMVSNSVFFMRAFEELRIFDCFLTTFARILRISPRTKKLFWGVFYCFGPISTKTGQQLALRGFLG